jgi:hypothetical protein
MAAVVTFWQLPEDEKKFLDFLLKTGNVVAMPAESVKIKKELVPQPIVPYIEQHDPVQLQFALERFAKQTEIEVIEHNGEKYFRRDYMSPCLISYRRGRCGDGKKLGLSNLSAYWDYPNEDNTKLLVKDPEFIHWAKKVFNWVRRATPARVECNGFPYRATKKFKEAVCEGKLEAVLY